MEKKKLTIEELKFNSIKNEMQKQKKIFFSDWSYSLMYYLNIGELRNCELKIKCTPLADGTMGLRLNMLEKYKMIVRVQTEKNSGKWIIRITEFGKKELKAFEKYLTEAGISYQEMLDNDIEKSKS